MMGMGGSHPLMRVWQPWGGKGGATPIPRTLAFQASEEGQVKTGAIYFSRTSNFL
jgi:hypothetical protein